MAEDTDLSSQTWADTRNDVNTIDTATFTFSLLRLPNGSASRLALSIMYAGLVTQHPDGDPLTLIDADPASATYHRIVGHWSPCLRSFPDQSRANP